MTSISFDTMVAENFSPFEIIEMDIKGKLFTIINSKLNQKEWNQKEAALALDITQPRVSNLKNLHHDKFSIEALMKLADKLECEIEVGTESGLTISVSE
ncbi:helix-turn-helix domain-containing protein [Vibrio crassostreae]|uniref:helix-turn-helix domain-containing protein n=1 Tax=Vibrio crassostreae TaxID=246167 RepID=UPI001B301B07|nr:XRE family transcriptional regulator [Vibrio crassostreae]